MIDISSFRKIGKFKIFKQSELLFMQNALGGNMYIVLKGVFGVYINSFTDFPVRVAGIPEGAFFGEMSVIDGSPRSATIISEELGMAISIEQEHFKSLLAQNPDIAAKILKTLSGRAEATAIKAREKGNTVADLPDNLKDPEQNPITDLDNMIGLAKRIRELNELLGVGEVKKDIEMKETLDMVTLLPVGHERFKEADDKDNSNILANWDYVCPYCKKGFKNKTPLLPRLIQKEKTIDQRIIYENFNILLYTNIVCPNCNFCDTYQEFSMDPIPLTKPTVNGNQFFNNEGFTGYTDDYKHTLDEAVLSYYLNIECLKQTPGSELRVAKAWQRLHWLYNDYGKNRLARNTALESFKVYSRYLEKNNSKLTAEEFMTINIILGEQCMFLGDTERAYEYFEKNTKVGGFTTHDLAVKSLKRIRDIKDK